MVVALASLPLQLFNAVFRLVGDSKRMMTRGKMEAPVTFRRLVHLPRESNGNQSDLDFELCTNNPKREDKQRFHLPQRHSFRVQLVRSELYERTGPQSWICHLCKRVQFRSVLVAIGSPYGCDVRWGERRRGWISGIERFTDSMSRLKQATFSSILDVLSIGEIQASPTRTRIKHTISRSDRDYF
jgi:hypothetical protein